MAGEQTNSFTIAHYILLFAVVVLCIGIVAWTMIHSGGDADGAAAPRPQLSVTHINTDDPCVQRIVNQVAQQWAYDPDSVPRQYWTVAAEYADQVTGTRFSGDCNGEKFSCRPGQVRRDCDPCAVSSALAAAQDQQVADRVAAECGGQ